MTEHRSKNQSEGRPKHRFLLVRLSSLGDVIHALPAASALRDTFPDARIDWVIDPSWKRLLEGNSDLTEVIAHDRKRAGGIASSLRKLRESRYTCAIDSTNRRCSRAHPALRGESVSKAATRAKGSSRCSTRIV
jgi:ADP-heptose:LPS heptosyltransferase